MQPHLALLGLAELLPTEHLHQLDELEAILEAIGKIIDVHADLVQVGVHPRGEGLHRDTRTRKERRERGYDPSIWRTVSCDCASHLVSDQTADGRESDVHEHERAARLCGVCPCAFSPHLP